MFKGLKELFSGTDLKGVIESYLKKLTQDEWKKYETEFPTERMSWKTKN